MSSYKYASILPFSVGPDKKVHFLLGQEIHEAGWGGSDTWSDWGGGPDGELPRVAAAREGFEETMGILGDESHLFKHMFFELCYRGKYGYTFLLPIKYNADLPTVFNNIYNYFKKCAKDPGSGKYVIASCPKGWFEKQDAKWFSAEEIYVATYNKWDVTKYGPKPNFRSDFLSGLKDNDFFKKFPTKNGLPQYVVDFLDEKKININT